MSPPALQTVKCNAVSGRVKGRRHKGFHAVGNGVHACSRCEPCRQAQREFGIANGCFGHQVPGVKAKFAVIVNDDEGTTCHFAARAACCGDGDKGRYTFCDSSRTAFYGGIGG